MTAGPAGSLTDVTGVQVGHLTDRDAATGCTVVLCESGTVGAVDVRGAAPATRETDLLRPENLVQHVNAVLLSGGSAFGLAAADGVMRYLEEREVGFRTRHGVVPIVVGAALFDLGLGSATVRPGATDGYAACLAASHDPVDEGSVGAGTGATVGHLLGRAGTVKGGLGSASRRLRSGQVVAALVAVNAWGDVVDPRSGRIVAGARGGDGSFIDSATQVELLAGRQPGFGQQTTLAVVATDAALARVDLLRVAQQAQDGLARAIRPAHTAFDGDAIFALSTAQREPADPTVVGVIAAEVLAEAIVRAVRLAGGLHGVPAVAELEHQ